MPHKLFQNVLDDVSYIISRFLTCLSWGLLTSVLPSIGGLRTTSMVSKHHTPHKVQFLDRDRNMGKWPACLAMPCHDDTVYGLYGQAILHQLGCLLGFPSRNNGTIITHRIHVWYTVYANIKGVYWWDPCYHSSTMDPSWVMRCWPSTRCRISQP
jgi:hypothetical protein